MSIILNRGPRTDDELYEVVKALWGITIPRHKVCSDHDAPFDAFATAYFNREPQILIHGSRGLSGKSRLLSILGLTVAAIQGSDVNIVGGSLNQSINIHNTIRDAWEHSQRSELPGPGGVRDQDQAHQQGHDHAAHGLPEDGPRPAPTDPAAG